jgi:hypothetical protein
MIVVDVRRAGRPTGIAASGMSSRGPRRRAPATPSSSSAGWGPDSRRGRPRPARGGSVTSRFFAMDSATPLDPPEPDDLEVDDADDGAHLATPNPQGRPVAPPSTPGTWTSGCAT